MQRNVVVSVKGSFAVTGSGIPESPEVEVITEGEYFEQGNLKCITYEEIDPQFPEPIRNIISINGQQVTMKKRGLINTDMTFRKNAEQITHYSTPYGNLILGIKATDMYIWDTEDELFVNIDYSLSLNYNYSHNCKVSIQVQSR